MVQFFKIASWDRLILMVILFTLMQIPFLFFNHSVLVPELLWIRLGERMAEGWRLYAQIADETGPVPALIYALLGKINLLDFRILRGLGSGLILIQAFWLNQIAQRYQLFSERHYLVAWFYLILCHLGPDSLSLSPVLIGLTFLLAAYNKIFKIIRFGPAAEDVIGLGIWLGFLMLCYQPSLLYLLPFSLSALFFSGLRINQYLNILVGSLLPTAVVYLFYSMGGGEQEFFRYFLSPFQLGFSIAWVGWDLYLGLGLLLFLLALIGWVIANQNSRVNFQQTGFSVFFFGLIASAILAFFGTTRSPNLLLFLVPHSAFFLAQAAVYIRNKFLGELAFLILLLMVYGLFLGISNPLFGKKIFNHSLFAEEPPKGFRLNFKDKKLLLLSNDFRYYKYNKPATQWFKAYLCLPDPSYSQTMEGLMYWYQVLAEDPPDLIYDPAGMIPPLAVRIPEIGKVYKASFYPNLYERKSRKFGQPQP